jgi:hypothetical protein
MPVVLSADDARLVTPVPGKILASLRDLNLDRQYDDFQLDLFCQNFTGVETLQSAINFCIKLMTEIHLRNPVFQQLGCKFLENFVMSDFSSTEQLKIAIEAIIKALFTHPDFDSVQRQGCATLNSFLMSGNSANCIAACHVIVEKGGVKAIIDGMLKHPNNIGLQRQGCGVLGNVAWCDPQFQFIIAKSNGLEVIISAMTTHLSHAGIQHSGCAALVSLLCRGAAYFDESTLPLLAAEKVFKAIVDSMRTHPEHPGVQRHACGALINLLYLETLALKSQASTLYAFMTRVIKDGLEVVVAGMGNHQSNSRVQCFGCLLVGKFISWLSDVSNKEECLWNIVSSLRLVQNGVEAVVVALQTYLGPDVHSRACEALFAIAQNPKNIAVIVEKKGIQAVVAAMNTHTDRADIQLFGCGVLGNIANNEDCNKLVLQAEGIKAIIAAMRNHCNSYVQDFGCRALVNLAENESIEVIATAMKTHLKHSNIQFHGCIAFRNFFCACNMGGALVAVASAAIIGAMSAHLTNAGVQRQGCMALSNIALYPENRIGLAQAGSIAAIVAAMGAHSSHFGVQRQGCLALKNITDTYYEGSTRGPAMSGDDLQKVTETILNAMDTHRLPLGVQHQACGALGNIVVHFSECQTEHETRIGLQVLCSKVIDQTIQAMSASRFHEGIQSQGCRVLANISFSSQNKALVAEKGGIATMVAGMQSLLFVAEVQHCGSGALLNIAKEDELKAKVVQAGGIIAVVAGMKTHVLNSSVQVCGCGLLGRLMSLSFADRVKADGGITAIVAAMRAHPMDTNVQANGCIALAMFTTKRNVGYLKDVGGLEVFAKALQNHPSSVSIQGHRSWMRLAASMFDD